MSTHEDHSDGAVHPAELPHLRRCLELAEEALLAGDGPFGSVLVSGDGVRLHEDRNRTVTTGDPTAHPEFTVAQWAGRNLGAEERASATVYTSGEHCAMCSAAHAWAGIGRIVYIASSAQLSGWRAGWGWPDAPVRPLSIQEVAPGVRVGGPVPELLAEIRELHLRRSKLLYPDSPAT
jgi:tRNA(Arg) A34 adenosine deaminase TadA